MVVIEKLSQIQNREFQQAKARSIFENYQSQLTFPILTLKQKYLDHQSLHLKTCDRICLFAVTEMARTIQMNPKVGLFKRWAAQKLQLSLKNNHWLFENECICSGTVKLIQPALQTNISIIKDNWLKILSSYIVYQAPMCFVITCIHCHCRLWLERDFAWWRHQMETFSALLALCAGNSPVTGEFPTQGPVTRSFGVFFDLRLSKRLGKQSWGWWIWTPLPSLWRHCNGWCWQYHNKPLSRISPRFCIQTIPHNFGLL